MSEIQMSGRFSLGNSSRNYGKFAVECDWNSKISQLRTEFGFSWKVVFEKKVDFFLKINKGGKFAYQMILFLQNVFFSILIWDFAAKN